MFELRKSFPFEASHQLVHHDGKCANLHGHSYMLTVELRASTLVAHGSKRNMVTDFADISHVVKKLVRSHLDHHHLNDSLASDSPTAEFIAFWCFHRLKADLPLLAAVEVRETPSASVVYRPPPDANADRRDCERAHCPHCATTTPKNGALSRINGNTTHAAADGETPEHVDEPGCR